MQAAEQSELIPLELLNELRQTPVLDKLEPATGISLFVDNPEAWPAVLHPLIRLYERFCFFVFRRTIRWSIFDHLIRMDKPTG